MKTRLAWLAIAIAVTCLWGCSGSEPQGYGMESWEGRWEDGTGFWLRISAAGDTLTFERSGEQADAATVFVLESMSEDFSTLVVIEKSDFAHYRHTLELVSFESL